VSLLFTGYMAVMGAAMLVTGVVSSRIGPKPTLLVGLVIIIAGAGLAGMSDTVRLPDSADSPRRPPH
jgi:ACDE family multidrug resistance protein